MRRFDSLTRFFVFAFLFKDFLIRSKLVEIVIGVMLIYFSLRSMLLSRYKILNANTEPVTYNVATLFRNLMSSKVCIVMHVDIHYLSRLILAE